MILIDTDALFRALDASADHHADVRDLLSNNEEPLILSPFVLAELDYFLRKRLGQEEQLRLLREVEAGSYELQLFDTNDVTEARCVIEQHQDLRISLADASIVVLARRLHVQDVLTFDHHFRTLEPRGPGTYFRVLPADA